MLVMFRVVTVLGPLYNGGRLTEVDVVEGGHSTTEVRQLFVNGGASVKSWMNGRYWAGGG